MEPLVSIIIPAYNAGKTLTVLLKSISASDYRNFEVIVVDDGSTDHTAEIARGLGCQVVSLGKNTGPANARNRGATKARGELLFFVDSDVRLERGTLAQLVETFERNEVDAVSGIYSPKPANEGFVQSYKALFTHHAWFGNGKLRATNVFSASCGAVKKDVFETLGGFNENLRWGMDFEHEEFGLRLAAKFRSVVNPQLQVAHYFPSFWPFLRTYFFRGMSLMYFVLYRKGFAKGGNVTPGASAATIAALLSPFFFMVSAPIMALIALGFFLAMHASFYRLVLKRKGILFAVGSVFMSYLVSIVVGSASFAAVILSMIKGNPACRLSRT